MGKWISTAAVFVTLSSQAAPQVALVSAGRCDDAELVAQFKGFSNGLRARMGERLLEEAQLMRQLSLLPSRAPEELERQMDAAELHYYEAEYAVAEQKVRDALSEVDRISAGSSRWKLVVRGELLHAMILRATSRWDEADEHFRRVLRLTPDFRLDPDFFPPSTRARFDRVRRQVESEPRIPIVVTVPSLDRLPAYAARRAPPSTPRARSAACTRPPGSSSTIPTKRAPKISRWMSTQRSARYSLSTM